MVLIIDTETTGLEGYPKDRVLEIGIAELDVHTGNVKPVYNELIRYDDIREFCRIYEREYEPIWVFQNTDIKIEDIETAEKDLKTVVEEVKGIVHGQQAPLEPDGRARHADHRI